VKLTRELLSIDASTHTRRLRRTCRRLGAKLKKPVKTQERRTGVSVRPDTGIIVAATGIGTLLNRSGTL